MLGPSPKEGSGWTSATPPPAPGCRVRRSSCILTISEDKRSTFDASLPLALFLGGAPTATALPRRRGRSGWAEGRPKCPGHGAAVHTGTLSKALPQMLEAEARGAMVMAVVRLEGGHTGATHMSHLQNTGRGSESTAFNSRLLSQKTNGSITGRGRESAAPTGKGLK